MNKLIKILMERENLSEAEARQAAECFQDEMDMCVEAEDMEGVLENWGLDDLDPLEFL
jgi:hypothetical protein